MREILKEIKTPYIDAQNLLILFADYKKPRECILRLVKQGLLIRLKNGFYAIAERIQESIPYEQIANMLYGPSYVSLEWALSFYGMIPERVYSITSITLGRNKIYHTPLGDFSYYATQKESYPLGIVTKKKEPFVGNYFIASCEKAVADLVFKSCKSFSKKELIDDLVESKRINTAYFNEMNKKLMEEIASSYRSKAVRYLPSLIGEL